MITFNPDSGDLGRASIRYTHPLEFHLILPYMIDILEKLHNSELSNLPFNYAFEFSHIDKDTILVEMNVAKLSPHVSFYNTDGIKLFEIRGQSGGITTGLICYLVTHD